MSDVKIPPDDTPDLTQMDPILDEYRGQKGAVIPVLQKAQKIPAFLLHWNNIAVYCYILTIVRS